MAVHFTVPIVAEKALLRRIMRFCGGKTGKEHGRKVRFFRVQLPAETA